MKKNYLFIIFILSLLFLFSCNEKDFRVVEGIYIEKEPAKTTYYEDEDIDFSDLIVKVKYSDGEEKGIKDYTLNYELKNGENIIDVKYLRFHTNFIINIKPRLLILDDYDNYLDKTIQMLDFNDYDYQIKDIRYAEKRLTDYLIAYDNLNYVETNIYGWEASLDEYGCVINKNTKVDILPNGIVLSAHGKRIKDIQNLEIGDYVYFNGSTVYVYSTHKPMIDPVLNKTYLKFFEVITYLNQLDSIEEKNIVISYLNTIIPLLNDSYENNIFDTKIIEKIYLELNNIIEKNDYVLSLYNKEEEYNNQLDQDIEYLDKINNKKDYELYIKYTDPLYIGGFRKESTLVYYDKDCYRTRNSYGYEIAVDKEGIVQNADVLVDLIEDGYILSGHTLTADLLRKIKIGDKVEIKEDGVYFYKNTIGDLYNSLIEEINYGIELTNLDLNNNLRHDYKLIEDLCKEIKKILPYEINHSLYSYLLSYKNFYKLNMLKNKLFSLLLNYDSNSLHGLWYYPLRQNNQLEQLKEEMALLNKIGINNIFITPFASDGCLFANSMYKTSNKALNVDTNGYKDYLEMFISLAHEYHIKVTAFTQTFLHYETFMKKNEDWTYQIDYNGQRSRGSVYYLDIGNDNIQDMLYNYYNELLNYDFDGIEYDIIRYSVSNLSSYLDVDVINPNVVITDPGWTDYNINKFKELYNLDNNIDLKLEILNNKELRASWLKYKEDCLINFLTKVSGLIRNKKPNIKISAAILSGYDNSRKNYLQDYQKWLSLNLIDYAEPMNYTTNLTAFNRVYNSYMNNEYSDLIRMGISSVNEKVNVANEFSQMRIAMPNGYIIFSNSIYLTNKEFVTLLSLIKKEDNI